MLQEKIYNEGEDVLQLKLKKRRNRYTSVVWVLFLRTLLKGKISFRKLFNVLWCTVAYIFKLKRSAPSPFILSLELSNECNANCLFCRDSQGRIYNINPQVEGFAGKGKMPPAMAIDFIEQLKKDVLIAVLYTNGEPLLYKDLPRIIQAATERRVATMIATNGLLLTQENILSILEAGLDFIKIQLSGYTQDTYSIQVRHGHVEKLKENLRLLVRINEEGGYNAVIVIDYILYAYNKHQLNLVREFCKELGVILNIRPGNPRGGLEDKEPPLNSGTLPLKMSCDWLWKGMQVNWNGEILQCCDGVAWINIEPFATFQIGKTDIKEVWNGPQVMKIREMMKTKGRQGMPICSQCTRTGVVFKW
jgi:MoaA/NifB/PqqE/SkfB family radical SAM enzyme